MWQIVISGPGYFDTQYDLPEGITTLGRADENDIVLSGDLVSRKHARIHVDRDRILVEDLGSRNGSKRNGQPFRSTVELVQGDLITVGENALQVRLASASESAKTEMVSAKQAEGVVRFGQGVDIESSVILAKNVRESLAYRLLDNVTPFDAPFEDTLPPEAVLKPTSPIISYDSLLLLYQVAQRLASAENLTTFLESTVDRLMANVNATTAVVLLRHVTGQLTPAVVRHRGKLARGEVPVSDAIIDAALSQGAALAVRDVQADSRFSGRESVLLYRADQVLCVPIGEKQPFSGVLYLNKTSRDDEALESFLEICTAVGHLVGSAVEKFDIRHRAPDEGRLRTALDRNLPPEVVDRRLTEIAQHGPSRVVQLEEQLVTLLSVDLVGAAKLPAAKLGQHLTTFQQRVRGVVFSFDGAMVEVTGDSALAVFGAPYGKDNDALRAVRAALSIRSDWTKQQRDAPALRVGVHTGKVIAGTIGTPLWAEFTVVGDAASVVSRVRNCAKPSQVLMTGRTLAAVGARFEVAALGERKLEETVKVALFEVLEEDLGQSTASGTVRNSD